MTPQSWVKLFFGFGTLFGLFFGLFAAILLPVSAYQFRLAERFDIEANRALAEITDAQIRERRDSDGDIERSYYMTFRFTTERDVLVERERSVGSGFYGAHSVGDELTVRYLSSEPETFEFKRGQTRTGAQIARWLGLGFGSVSLVLLGLSARRATRMTRVLRNGEKRIAVVTEIRDTNVRKNNRRQSKLAWREADGQTGESRLWNSARLETLYRPGEEIVVYRLGDKVQWEGDVGPAPGEGP